MFICICICYVSQRWLIQIFCALQITAQERDYMGFGVQTAQGVQSVLPLSDFGQISLSQLQFPHRHSRDNYHHSVGLLGSLERSMCHTWNAVGT